MEQSYIPLWEILRLNAPKEIIDNDLDLSYNRYKEYEYDEQTYELPKEILSKLISLEKEILFDMNELIELIG